MTDDREYITPDTQLRYATLDEMAAWARDLMDSRAPDFIIGPGDPDYIRRWYVIPRNNYSNQYLHLTLRSDDDRALHDHPWNNTSVIIEGGYWEITPRFMGSYCGQPDDELDRIWRGPGDIITRTAETSHRLIIPEGGRCVSLFSTGPKIRDWGFWCPQGWRHWEKFTAGPDGAAIGQGCD